MGSFGQSPSVKFVRPALGEVRSANPSVKFVRPNPSRSSFGQNSNSPRSRACSAGSCPGDGLHTSRLRRDGTAQALSTKLVPHLRSKCFGWPRKARSGEVRDVAAQSKDEAKARRCRVAVGLRDVPAFFENLLPAGRTSPGFAPRIHPLQLRGEGFAPCRCASTAMCANRSHFVEKAANSVGSAEISEHTMNITDFRRSGNADCSETPWPHRASPRSPNPHATLRRNATPAAIAASAITAPRPSTTVIALASPASLPEARPAAFAAKPCRAAPMA